MLRLVLGLGLSSSIIEKAWKSLYVIKFFGDSVDQRSCEVVRERLQYARGSGFDSRWLIEKKFNDNEKMASTFYQRETCVADIDVHQQQWFYVDHTDVNHIIITKFA